MSEILAANIRTLRLSLALDQTQFGERLDVSQGTVSRWEKGSDPGHGSLVKMANMARCTVEEFTTQVMRAPGVRITSGATLSAGRSVWMLPVQLPSEEALTDMFQSLLAVVDDRQGVASQAAALARLLPPALAETVYRQADQAGQVALVPKGAGQARSTGDQEG